MKVSTSSKKEPSSKLKKLEEKLKAKKLENGELRKINRALKKQAKTLRLSRDNWKSRNSGKRNKIKGLEKKIAKLNTPKRHHYDLCIIRLCVLLRVVGGCSYRSIPRLLKVLQLCFSLNWKKLPCANSVENWVSKLGLYNLERGVERIQKEHEQVCLILDENLRLGNERMLLLMLSPYEKLKQGALSYEDVEIVYMGGKESWTGDKIRKQVEKLVTDKELRIGNILSDEDSKLLKSARLLNYPHLPDIGHAIGNCLRKVFKKNDAYQAFIKLIGLLQSKSVNQKLTYLRPPKQRIKARFMNQAPLVKWGLMILNKFEKLTMTEQFFFKDLTQHRVMLNTLDTCIKLSKSISAPLKEEGLNQTTLQNLQQQIAQYKQELQRKNGEKQMDDLVGYFIECLETYALKYEAFLGDKTGTYQVSSDVIESIFGKHKELEGTNPYVGMTMLDLELPVHCQSQKEIFNQVQPAVEAVFMSDLFDWRQSNTSDNQALKRKLWFQN